MLTDQTNKVYTKRQIMIGMLVIFICCVISYWPVSLGIFSLKNDAVRYFLPVRYQVSEMIRNGNFPFWTPFINLGHPLYTDMQSGVWNPFVWILSSFGPYTMRSLQIELMIYVYLSGVSMFYLLKHLKLSFQVSLAIAVSYMLCGFISDSTQFLYWVSGMSFFPLVFLFFLKTLKEHNFRSNLLFSFSLYLLFVTAYPGEFIIIIYFLIAYLIIYIINNRNNLQQLLRSASLIILLFTLFSLPVIISYLSGIQNITRGSAVSYEMAMTNSMNPLSLLSYIFPLIAWKLPIAETDILGRNSYIGLFPCLLLFISFAVRSKSTLVSFLKWVFILSLLLSFGKYGVLRIVAYYLLPLMDMFRHPSIFRFITVFSGCVLAAITLQNVLTTGINPRLKKNIFGVTLLLLIIAAFAILLTNKNGFVHLIPDAFSISSFKTWLENSSVVTWLIIELIIQGFFLFLIYQYFIRNISLNYLIPVIVLNSVIHVSLIQPVTVVSSETVSSFSAVTGSEKQHGFPILDPNSSILSNSKVDQKYFLKYGPINMYNKKPGYQFEFVTPGPLKSHERFMATEGLTEILFKFPFLYKADTACFYQAGMNYPSQKRFVLTEDSTLLFSINKESTDSNYQVKMLSFSPGKWEFEIQSSSPGFYCLIQNYYPNWELFINDKKDNPSLCNVSLIGFNLNPGVNKVHLQFKDNKVMTALYVQLFTWALMIVYFLIIFLKRKSIK